MFYSVKEKNFDEKGNRRQADREFSKKAEIETEMARQREECVHLSFFARSSMANVFASIAQDREEGSGRAIGKIDCGRKQSKDHCTRHSSAHRYWGGSARHTNPKAESRDLIILIVMYSIIGKTYTCWNKHVAPGTRSSRLLCSVAEDL